MEQGVNQFSRQIQRVYRRFNSFPSHKKVFALLLLVLALPIAVYLVRTFTLYVSRAATAELSFSPSSATLPPNSTLGVMVDSGSAPIAFARVEISFDQTKVNLSDEIQITGPLEAVIGKTSRANANSSGHLVVVVALCNAIDIPCDPQPEAPSGSFELFKLPLTAVASQQSTTDITYDISVSQLVDTTQSNVTLSGSNATLNLNQSGGGGTATPTRRPGTPTSRPNSPSPRPTSSNPQANTTLALLSGRTSVAINQTLPISVRMETNGNGVIGADLDITFDSSMLEVVEVRPGSFFTDPDVSNEVIDNENGRVRVTINTPPGSNARNGSANIAVVDVRGLAEGETRLDFGEENLVAAVNMEGQNALRSVTGLGITVTQSSLLGDINEDGTVDIVDYVILFANFGKNANESGADPRADVNSDGKINILDYTYVFENFGRSA